MANASRPKKSSQRKTSSRGQRGLSPKGTVPVSTGSAKRRTRPKVDPLELYVTLVAGAENLSVSAARGLLHLRQTVIAAQKAARGALIKLELDEDGKIDWWDSAAKAPVLRDIVSLLLLQLIDDFPLHAPASRRLLANIQRRVDVSNSAFDVRGKMIRDTDRGLSCPDPWKNAAQKARIDDSILVRLSLLAIGGVREMMAASMRIHRKRRLAKSNHCPVCAAMPYATKADQFLCSWCETRWPASRTMDCMCYPPEKWKRVEERSADGFEVLQCAKDKCTAYNLDPALDAAFDPYWYVRLVKLMDAPYKKSALQSPRG